MDPPEHLNPPPLQPRPHRTCQAYISPNSNVIPALQTIIMGCEVDLTVTLNGTTLLDLDPIGIIAKTVKIKYELVSGHLALLEWCHLVGLTDYDIYIKIALMIEGIAEEDLSLIVL